MPKIKDETYVINLDEYELIGTHWIALYLNGDNVTYFDSFEVTHIQKKLKKVITNKNIITNEYHESNIMNTSICFSNMWILLYWIYCFYDER